MKFEKFLISRWCEIAAAPSLRGAKRRSNPLLRFARNDDILMDCFGLWPRNDGAAAISHQRLIILIIMTFLSGCGGDVSERELKEYINTLKEKAAAKEQVKTQPIVWKLPAAVTYKPNGYAVAASSANVNVTNPLQALPLSALKFVGTLVENNQVNGYIMTPDNMIYLVKVGDIIGEEYDRIVKIDDRHLEISKKTLTGQEVVTMELKESQ